MKHRLVSVVALAAPGHVGRRSPGRTRPNALSAKEKAAGWQLLFDGKSTAGWRGFKTDKFPEKGWKVVDGAPGPREGGQGRGHRHQGSLRQLRAALRLPPHPARQQRRQVPGRREPGEGRAGRASRSSTRCSTTSCTPTPRRARTATAPAAVSTTCSRPRRTAGQADGRSGTRRASWSRPARSSTGSTARRSLSFTRGGPELKAAIAESKFKEIPGFGETAKGHILLQDHNDEIAFRNIKLRKIPARAASR